MELENNVCPFCQSTNVKGYAYGLMSFSSEEERNEFNKTYLMAGCEMSPEAPTHHCENCKKDFGHLGG